MTDTDVCSRIELPPRTGSGGYAVSQSEGVRPNHRIHPSSATGIHPITAFLSPSRAPTSKGPRPRQSRFKVEAGQPRPIPLLAVSLPDYPSQTVRFGLSGEQEALPEADVGTSSARLTPTTPNHKYHYSNSSFRNWYTVSRRGNMNKMRRADVGILNPDPQVRRQNQYYNSPLS